jgi:protein-L-isoaspartate(D-aspartate) O-methyltransferase
VQPVGSNPNASKNESAMDAVALRNALVDELKAAHGLNDSAIEAAFRAVPRHLFLPATPVDEAYKNIAVVTKQVDQKPVSSASQPSAMTMMLEQLQLEPGNNVLEIGAGAGYNAALMATIVGDQGQVITIDIDADLVEQARENLSKTGFERVRVLCADGGAGYPAAGPYDRIILTVGAPDIAPAWWEQLKPGGRLVIPLSLLENGVAKSIAFERSGNCLVSKSVKDCGFIMLRGQYAAPTPAPIPIPEASGVQLVLTGDGIQSGDGSAVYKMLSGAQSDIPTGVEVTGQELTTRFLTWLALQPESRSPETRCSLTSVGEAAGNELVPCLFGLAGKYRVTTGLADKGSLALLMRPPGSTMPSQMTTDDPPFQLYIRSFGEDDRLARTLAERVSAWAEAGKPPDPDRMRVTAYPKDSDYTRSPNELISEKPNTRIVIGW